LNQNNIANGIQIFLKILYVPNHFNVWKPFSWVRVSLLSKCFIIVHIYIRKLFSEVFSTLTGQVARKRLCIIILKLTAVVCCFG